MEWLRTAIALAGGPVAVSRASGVSNGHICNILSGRRRLTSDVAQLLAPALPSVEVEQWVWATLGPSFVQKAAPRRRRQRTGRIQRKETVQ